MALRILGTLKLWVIPNMKFRNPEDGGAMQGRYKYIYHDGENKGREVGAVADAKITDLLTSVDELEYLLVEVLWEARRAVVLKI